MNELVFDDGWDGAAPWASVSGTTTSSLSRPASRFTELTIARRGWLELEEDQGRLWLRVEDAERHHVAEDGRRYDVTSFSRQRMVLQDNGAGRILVFVIGVVCSDVGGYIAGVLFGKHPMAPAISPKKSWEGLVGSLIFCVIGCLLTVTLILEANSMIGVLLGVVLVVTGTLGDLIESQVKRDLRIKDMGSLLPGHGGIMDRLDSLLPSAFVAWLVFTVLL